MKLHGFIILFAFLAVSILGFSSLAHESHAAHHSCLFNPLSNCAVLVDPINSALEHLSSLQNSIQASLGQSNILTLLLLTFLLIIAGLISAKAKLKTFHHFQKHRTRFLENLFEFKIRFLAWLSILNKRDPLAVQTAR